MTGSYSLNMALFSLGTIWKATLTVTWCLMTLKSYAHGRAIKMIRLTILLSSIAIIAFVFGLTGLAMTMGLSAIVALTTTLF